MQVQTGWIPLLTVISIFSKECPNGHVHAHAHVRRDSRLRAAVCMYACTAHTKRPSSVDPAHLSCKDDRRPPALSPPGRIDCAVVSGSYALDGSCVGRYVCTDAVQNANICLDADSETDRCLAHRVLHDQTTMKLQGCLRCLDPSVLTLKGWESDIS